jgi:hypothetical protein
MATNIELAHATASATLAPRLTAVKTVVKFVRTKPLGAGGAQRLGLDELHDRLADGGPGGQIGRGGRVGQRVVGGGHG